MRVLLTIHHGLDLNSGAPGATLALRDAYKSLGHMAEILSHNDLPGWASGRAALFTFPLLVAWSVLLGSRRRRFDWVECSAGDGWVLSLAPKAWRPPLSLRSHGLEHVAHERLMEQVRRGDAKVGLFYRLYRGSVHLWLIGVQARRSEVCLALNRTEAQVLNERCGVAPPRVMTVPNGATDSVVRPCWRSVGTTEREGLHLAFIGRFTLSKGSRELVSMFEAYAGGRAEAALHMLGCGGRPDEVLSSFDAGVRDQVRVTPSFARNELLTLLADAEVFVLPSHSEGFSLSVVEAMALGLAPIISDRTGVCDFVEHGREAVVVPHGDVEALVGAIVSLDEDREKLAELRKAAYEASKRFTWEAVAKQCLEAYVASLGSAGSSPRMNAA